MSLSARIQERREAGQSGLGIGAGFGLVLLVAIAIIYAIGCKSVSAGEACVVTRFGKVRGIAEPGLNSGMFNDYSCYSTRRLVYETSEQPKDSKADYADFHVDARTRDGQQIDAVTFSVGFKIPAQNVGTIYNNVARTEAQIVERVVKFHSRSIVRNSMQEYPADKLYSNQIDDVAGEILGKLRPEFEAAGIQIESFAIRKIDFNQGYEQSVNARQIAFEQTRKAEQDAKTAEATALGAAKAEIEKARGDAEAQRLRAAAEAESIRLRGEALRQNPTVAQLEFFEAIKAGKVQFLPSTGIQALLPITTP